MFLGTSLLAVSIEAFDSSEEVASLPLLGLFMLDKGDPYCTMPLWFLYIDIFVVIDFSALGRFPMGRRV